MTKSTDLTFAGPNPNLQQALADVENALLTAVEHGDAIEAELIKANDKLTSEIRDRVKAERRLAKVLEAVSRQNQDLELLVQTITEHSDDIDVHWLKRYAEVENLSNTDILTGLSNRRLFEKTLEQEWSRCRRENLNVALLMCDVDFFKNYNDRYGHPQGDEVLRAVGESISKICKRPGDFAARVGGEEFAILLPNTDAEGAFGIAESLRTELFDRGIEHLNSPFGRVTMSLGIAVLDPSSGVDAGELIVKADEQLYRAKNVGRNCACSSDDPNGNLHLLKVEKVGEPIHVDETKVMESLVLSFSPSLFSLQERWRSNGLSADFLADYVSTFCPVNGDESDAEMQKASFRSAISYIANELLENGMKHSLNSIPYPITIRVILEADQILFVASNMATTESANTFMEFVKKLDDSDPQEFYISILENSDAQTSGLGLVTMINDYEASLAWEFEETSRETSRVSTKVRLKI